MFLCYFIHLTNIALHIHVYTRIINIAVLMISMFKARVPIQMHCNYWHRDANNRSIYRQTNLFFPSLLSFPKGKYSREKGFLWEVRLRKNGAWFFGGESL